MCVAVDVYGIILKALLGPLCLQYCVCVYYNSINSINKMNKTENKNLFKTTTGRKFYKPRTHNIRGALQKILESGVSKLAFTQKYNKT